MKSKKRAPYGSVKAARERVLASKEAAKTHVEQNAALKAAHAPKHDFSAVIEQLEYERESIINSGRLYQEHANDAAARAVNLAAAINLLKSRSA